MSLCAGCSTELAPVAATPDFFTATMPPTPTTEAMSTVVPPVPTSTVEVEVVLVEGMTTTQVNVRAEPSTASVSLGMIGIFAKVQIAGRDSSGSWYQILYAESDAGKGWVRAEYVQVNPGVEIRPVNVSPVSGSGVSGMVTQKVNVRSGPGVDYEVLGGLSSNDLVAITGKDAAGGWLQIEFATSPDGKGWVAAEFLQVTDIESVPSIGATVEETPAPSGAPAPTVVSQTAVQDGDSMQTPLAVTAFSVTGSRALQVQGDVSAPDGDAEDWVQFESMNGVVAIKATCPESVMRVELWHAGSPVKSFSCGEQVTMDVAADNDFFIRLIQGEAGYTAYVLNLEVLP